MIYIYNNECIAVQLFVIYSPNYHIFLKTGGMVVESPPQMWDFMTLITKCHLVMTNGDLRYCQSPSNSNEIPISKI